MSLTYPYAVSVLADKLKIVSVVWDIQRNDELSGTGDGRVWQAELAPPLWTGDVTLAAGTSQSLKQIAALMRGLQGAQNQFYLGDPLSPYPQFDPDGSILGSHTVQINTIGTDNQSISLKGLPAGFVVTLGDKGHVDFSSSPTRRWFFEIDETITADGGGNTVEFQVFPHLPVGVIANAVVVLKKPAAKMFIVPGSMSPGTGGLGGITDGFKFKALEKK